MTAAFLEQVRHQEAHLVVSEGILSGPQQLIPSLLRSRLGKRRGNKLVPAVWQQASYSTDAAGKHMQEFESAGHLPAAQVARGGIAPDVAGKGRSSRDDVVGQATYHFGSDSAFLRRKLRSVLGVQLLASLGARSRRYSCQLTQRRTK